MVSVGCLRVVVMRLWVFVELVCVCLLGVYLCVSLNCHLFSNRVPGTLVGCVCLCPWLVDTFCVFSSGVLFYGLEVSDVGNLTVCRIIWLLCGGVRFDFGLRVGLIVLTMIKDFGGVCLVILVV